MYPDGGLSARQAQQQQRQLVARDGVDGSRAPVLFAFEANQHGASRASVTKPENGPEVA